MNLIARISLATLVLVSTSSAAAPCNQCAGAAGPAASAAGEMVTIPGLTTPHPGLGQIDRTRHNPCIAELMGDNDRLVALHRSIRDGGLGVLRTPTSAFASATTAASAANPAGCNAG